LDLHLTVCAAAIVVGAVMIGLGLRLLSAALPPPGAAAAGRPFLVSGAVFAVLGAAAIALAGFSLFGPARDRGLGIFPMGVLDLNAPAEPIQPGPPREPEAPPSTPASSPGS
jgi:hypothetical protein